MQKEKGLVCKTPELTDYIKIRLDHLPKDYQRKVLKPTEPRDLENPPQFWGGFGVYQKFKKEQNDC